MTAPPLNDGIGDMIQNAIELYATAHQSTVREIVAVVYVVALALLIFICTGISNKRGKK